MIATTVPGVGELRLAHLVLDVNGTLTTDGVLGEALAPRLARLGELLSLHLVSADTRGTVALLSERLGARWERVTPGREAEHKRDYVRRLGADEVAAIGNGANDALMVATARLGIVVIGREGCATATLLAGDVVCGDIGDALDLLLDPTRLIATLRR